MGKKEKHLITDVLIVGGGGAGARAAIEVARLGLRATMALKGRLGKSGATPTAPGDYALDSNSACELGLPGDRSDSKEIFLQDIVKAGQYLNDQRVVEAFVEDAPARLVDLIDMGVPWTRLHRYGGHSYPRGAEVGKIGETGVSIMNALRKEAQNLGVEVIEDCVGFDLLVKDDTVVGAVCLDLPRGKVMIIRAKAVVLATGGGSRLYSFTSNPEECTGDGIAMAYRAGAELVDMEFVQFLPTSPVWPPGLKGLDIFAVYLKPIGLLEAWLLNSWGERFMSKWDPVRMELSTRDIITAAITTEIKEGRGGPHGGVYLSVRHLPENLIDNFAQRLMPGWEFCGFSLKGFGIDLKKDALEVAPAAHYFNGGVKIDDKCQTNLRGLFAAGEMTGGLHGANRLSGNAVAETQVFGARAGHYAAEFAAAAPLLDISQQMLEEPRGKIYSLLDKEPEIAAFELYREIQEIAWEGIGPLRTAQGLTLTIEKAEKIRKDALPRMAATSKEPIYNIEWMKGIESYNMVDLVEIIAKTALKREESRGSHYRTDFPKTDTKGGLCNLVVKKVDGTMNIERRFVKMTKFKPD